MTLSRADHGGNWVEIAATRTGQNGRTDDCGDHNRLTVGTYLLQFDMTRYDAVGDAPFFPTMLIVFTVLEDDASYHVPVLVSRYGYSTYRGN